LCKRGLYLLGEVAGTDCTITIILVLRLCLRTSFRLCVGLRPPVLRQNCECVLALAADEGGEVAGRGIEEEVHGPHHHF